ncbi:MAG: 3-dehydroquinate synthase [Gracilibacter sp. BRH_c7a]|nr:MAG: 3-dehydroquinate synthase [Gracilibacter sp. BRH_c7a]
MRQRIDVGGSHGYPLFLGVPLEELGSYLENRYGAKGHYLVITNPIIADLYSEKLMEGLKNFRTDLITVPDSEEEKSLDRISKLTEQALRCRADRDTMVLALGGGVIGDLAGFFASIFVRGIRYIHIPTTLLAQIDSSIGGKVAVNHPSGKNLLGSFYPPQAVWTDYSTLTTLPWEEIQNGLAETIKHALVADSMLFEFIEDHTADILNRDPKIMKELAMRSMAVKVKIVTEDEKEKGNRILLNLGHSFGHALETDAKYKGVSHGQGVSIGLVAIANLAFERNLLSEKQLVRIVDLLEKLGLPTYITDSDPQSLLQHMLVDKKNKAGNKILILPVGIGKSSIATDCEDEEIVRAWKKIMK